MDHVGHLDVTRGGLVEGRGDDLGLHRPPHVRHLFGPLVDQQHDQVDLRMVLGDRVRDVLQDHRLARLGRRRDQGALSLPDRCDQVDDARRDAAGLRFEVELLLGIERRQVVEEDLVARLLGRLEVDRLDLQQREVALAFLGRADLAFDAVTRPQVETPDLRRGHVDVVGPGEVVLVRRAEESEAVLQDLEHALGEDLAVLGGLGLEDCEHQVLLAHARRILDLHLLGDLRELLHRVRLEVADVDALAVVVLVGGGLLLGEILLRGQVLALDGLPHALGLHPGIATPAPGPRAAAASPSSATAIALGSGSIGGITGTLRRHVVVSLVGVQKEARFARWRLVLDSGRDARKRAWERSREGSSRGVPTARRVGR